MKASTVFFVSLFVPCLVHGLSTPPSWALVEGKPVEFYKDKGFGFSVDDCMAHHYEKPTVEISVLIPTRFTHANLKNKFDSVGFLSEDISTDLETHPHSRKKRIILTISEDLIRKSQVVFYFRNQTKGVTQGSMYVLDLVKALDDWKTGQVKNANKAIPGMGARRFAQPAAPTSMVTCSLR